MNLIGSNDVRIGTSAATYEATFDSINNAATAAGIRVLVGVLYESSVNMLPLVQSINAHYPAANIIDLYDPMNVSGDLYSDNVHPNNYGDSIASSVIIQAFKFYNQSPRYTPNNGGAYNWWGTHNWYVQPGETPINIKSFNSSANNFQTGAVGIQSVAVNNEFLQENSFFNGSQSIYLNNVGLPKS